MPVRFKSGQRRRRGRLLASIPQLTATGSGSALNPSFTGSLLALVPALAASGAGIVGSGSGGDNDGLIVSNYATYDPDNAVIQSWDINNTIPTAITGGASVSYADEPWWSGTARVATFYPPVSGDSYCGFSNLFFWKGATKPVRQLTVRWETRFSDLHLLNAAGLPKWIIIDAPRLLSAADGVMKDRPMLYLAHMNEADNVSLHIPNVLVATPAQGTMRCFAAANRVPAYRYGDAGISTYCNMRQQWYIGANAGVDGAGNPIIDNDEYLCIEMRVNVMSTADEPFGVIAMRLYRRNGDFFEMATSWDNTPNGSGERPLLDTNFISRIDVMGGGYYNLGQPSNAGLWTKIGRRLTTATNYRPTVGRAWLGPPTGFVI